MNSINEDGGVYTSDEEDLERQCKTSVEKVHKETADFISKSPAGDQVEILEVTESVSVTVARFILYRYRTRALGN